MSDTTDQPMPFGFWVLYRPAYRYGGDPSGGASPAGWTVDLPHQCDDWDIHPGGYDVSPQAEALAELDRFIAEAQQARDALAAGRQFNEDRR